jgi:hypothetical protein
MASYTLMETAKFQKIDTQAWLRDVLARIADQKFNRTDEFLLWKKWGDETPKFYKYDHDYDLRTFPKRVK